jgi:hypothetical protein
MTEQALAIMDYNPLALMPKNAAEAKDLARIMADSDLIPLHLKKKPGDCMMIVMQSHRWQMDPFVVAQCTSVVHGKMCYEGKLVAAALTTMNAIEGRLSYDIVDLANGDKQITITGTPRGGKEQKLTGTVSGWRTPNKSWDNDPVSMLVYRGTRQWARLFAPEAILGVYTPDEFDAPELVTATVVVPSTEVPQVKKAAPQIVDAEVIPATPTTAPQAAAAAPAASPASPPPPSSPPPQQAAPAPQPQAATAPTSSGNDLPFGDPNEPQVQPGPNGPDDPRWQQNRAAASTAPTGDPLSETQMRIIKSRQGVVGVTDDDLKASFPKIGKGNINDVLAWLESKRKPA